MNDSILNSIKKLLGILSDCNDFNTDIIIHINTALMKLNQLGIGEEGFSIKNESTKWSDFTDSDQLDGIKTYVYLQVKLLFDPPYNAAIMDSIKETIKELEWRLNVRKESEIEE